MTTETLAPREEITLEAAPVASPAPAPLVPLHRNRDFMLLWVGQVISTVGSRVTGVAYPLLVLVITGSPLQAGIVGFAQTLPFLLLFLPAGALVDRWNRRRVMLVCEAGRALAMASVAVAIPLGIVSLPQLVIVAFIEGSLFVFFDLSEGASLPRLVPREQLPNAIAQNQARTQGADLVGQPLGGALFAISRALPFAFDAVSYIVSLGLIALIRKPLQEERAPTTEPPNLRREIAEGIATVFHSPFLRMSVVLVAGINFAFNASGLVLIVRAQELGADPPLIGTMFAFLGAGAIVGSLAAPAVKQRFGTRAVMVAIAWLWVIDTLALAFAPNVIALGIVAGLGAIFGPPFNVVLGNVIFLLTPDRLLGRVRSVVKLVAWGTIPAGVLTGGFLAGAIGPVTSILVLTVVLLVVGVVATFAPSLRSVPAE